MVIEVKADASFALRAVGASACIALGCVVLGLALRGEDPYAPVALSFAAVLVLSTGLIRAVLWILLAGTVVVRVGDGELWLGGWFVSAARFELGDVDSVVVCLGDRFPEWARWAALPTLVISSRDPGVRTRRHRIMLSSTRIQEVNRAFDAVLRR